MMLQQPECTETSAYIIQTPGNYAEGSMQQEVNILNSLHLTLLFTHLFCQRIALTIYMLSIWRIEWKNIHFGI